MIASARTLNFVTVYHIPIQTEVHLSKILNKVIGGFLKDVVLMVREFEKVLENLGKV